MVKEPLACDSAKARIGCKMIADHIFELAEASRAVLDSATGRGGMDSMLRTAYILNLTAYEEAGKLFMMWQALADAERRNLDSICIKEFELHEPKGDLAGDSCCQMLDFVEGNLVRIVDSISGIEPSLRTTEQTSLANMLSMFRTSLSAHKERIYRIRRHFKQEREDAMYIDFRSGDWIDPPRFSSQMLFMDCLLLEIVAKAANAYLAEGLDFKLATKALSDMSMNVKSDDARKFLLVLQKRNPEWFGVLNGKGT